MFLTPEGWNVYRHKFQSNLLKPRRGGTSNLLLKGETLETRE